MDNQNYSKLNINKIPLEIIYYICISIESFRDLLSFMMTSKIYYKDTIIVKIMTEKYDYKVFSHDYWMTMYLYNAKENNLLSENEVQEMKKHFIIDYNYEDILPYKNKFNRFVTISGDITPNSEDPTLFIWNYVMCFCDNEICKKEMYVYETQERYCLYCDLVGQEFCTESDCHDFSEFFRHKTPGISRALKIIESRKDGKLK